MGIVCTPDEIGNMTESIDDRDKKVEMKTCIQSRSPQGPRTMAMLIDHHAVSAFAATKIGPNSSHNRLHNNRCTPCGSLHRKHLSVSRYRANGQSAEPHPNHRYRYRVRGSARVVDSEWVAHHGSGASRRPSAHTTGLAKRHMHQVASPTHDARASADRSVSSNFASMWSEVKGRQRL